MKPQRIQLSRRKGWRMPENTVKVDRSTPWGNPYQAGVDGDGNRQYLVDCFRAYINRPEQAALRERARQILRGKNVGCWCGLDDPCHGDVWLEISNQ